MKKKDLLKRIEELEARDEFIVMLANRLATIEAQPRVVYIVSGSETDATPRVMYSNGST